MAYANEVDIYPMSDFVCVSVCVCFVYTMSYDRTLLVYLCLSSETLQCPWLAINYHSEHTAEL